MIDMPNNHDAMLISLTVTNILTILAIIVGPIAALMIQRHIDQRREADRRRHGLFRTLWSTKAFPGRLQYKHVEALNMVSLDFKGFDAVIDAWNEYLDKLLSSDPPEIALKAQFYKERDAKFHALLYAISKALDYSFTRLDVEKHFYAPLAHGTWAEQESTLREGFARLFRGEASLPVRLIAETDSQVTENQLPTVQLQPRQLSDK